MVKVTIEELEDDCDFYEDLLSEATKELENAQENWQEAQEDYDDACERLTDEMWPRG
jgi:hypothetical protein